MQQGSALHPAPAPVVFPFGLSSGWCLGFTLSPSSFRFPFRFRFRSGFFLFRAFCLPSLRSFELPSGWFSGYFPPLSFPLPLSVPLLFQLLSFPSARSFELASVPVFRVFFRIFSNPENDTDETLTTSGCAFALLNSRGVLSKDQTENVWYRPWVNLCISASVNSLERR